MNRIRISEDPEECHRAWETVWPRSCFFDLWEVRHIFAQGFGRKPFFVMAEENGVIRGLLALSWIEEGGYYGQYPGEIWQQKTWLEQNRIPVENPEIFQDLLDSVPGHLHLRYLTPDSLPLDSFPVAVDEVGYCFYPPTVEYDFSRYWQLFSGKSRKQLTRELAPLEAHGVGYRYDHFNDLAVMFQINQDNFGETSYFFDPRFLDSFTQLAAWLREQNLLRVTTLLLGGQVAAIDLGVLWNNQYTLLAGATNPEFPGVAKLINLHHLEWSCRIKCASVDFLCGDFGWKKRFHLTPRPLYEIKSPQIHLGAADPETCSTELSRAR
ncbi:MAG: GNAT family N-acetyltransferase [Proteobacteria bacterium]|nr:GNAT family N-acetyltransferase [Pseudomonadota bacterium]MBU1686083.1 GNAT family N-acetyltransferase [Pseudomonadota bacterium]